MSDQDSSTSGPGPTREEQASTAEPARPVSRRWLLQPLVVLVAFAACCWPGWLSARVVGHRIEVHNSSGEAVDGVSLAINELGGGVVVQRGGVRLEPGESLVVYHLRNDTSARLRFTAAGREVVHTEGYMDLWTGEGWKFVIEAGGSVRSWYDYEPHHEQRRR